MLSGRAGARECSAWRLGRSHAGILVRSFSPRRAVDEEIPGDGSHRFADRRAAAAAQAQSSNCPPAVNRMRVGARDVTQDACQQAVDVYQFMAPQLGLALTGGNATLGQGGALGGLGHFSIGVRANAFRVLCRRSTNLPSPRFRRARARASADTSDFAARPCPTATPRSACSRAFRSASRTSAAVDAARERRLRPERRRENERHASSRTIRSSSATARASASFRNRSSSPGVSVTLLAPRSADDAITGTSSDATST